MINALFARNFGFNFTLYLFLIKTHQVDLNSQFAMQLKREMLIKLAKKDTDLYPNDIEKRERIYKRYKEFEVPVCFIKNSFYQSY